MTDCSRLLDLSVDIVIPGDLHGLWEAQIQTEEERAKEKRKKNLLAVMVVWMEQVPVKNHVPTVGDLCF